MSHVLTVGGKWTRALFPQRGKYPQATNVCQTSQSWERGIILHISLCRLSCYRGCLEGGREEHLTTHVNGCLCQPLHQRLTAIILSCSILHMRVPAKPFSTATVISYFVGVLVISFQGRDVCAHISFCTCFHFPRTLGHSQYVEVNHYSKDE